MQTPSSACADYAVRTPGLVLLWLVCCGCRTFAVPDPLLLDRLQQQAEGYPASIRQQLELTLDSDSLVGTFQGALVTRAGRPLRLQLFPDLGSKVLDLVLTDKTLEFIGKDGEHVIRPLEQGLPRQLPELLAVTFSEVLTPLTPECVVGARRFGEGGWELHLREPVPGIESYAIIDGEGRVQQRWFRQGVLRWNLCHETPQVVSIDVPGWLWGTLLTARWQVIEEDHPTLPDALFQLAPFGR